MSKKQASSVVGSPTSVSHSRQAVLPPHRPGRVAIEAVSPELDGGRYPVKRVPGERVQVEVDLIADGHDVVCGQLLYRHADAPDWTSAPLTFLVNDRFTGEFTVQTLGRYQYTVEAWVDGFLTWHHGLKKKVEANQDVALDLVTGANLVAQAAERAQGELSQSLRERAHALRATEQSQTSRAALADTPELLAWMAQVPDKTYATRYARELWVRVDRERARFGAWYELFPRSTATTPGKHGTFADAIQRLPYVADMGFDVVYLPPIHPIGRAHRKGRNNNVVCKPGEPGSPWAIGSAEGGHKAVHPLLGTLDDFDRFVAAAQGHHMEVALDIAFQCSPDHPYVREHPAWFRKRSDGSIQYAENPPKKYQDIYPFDFETEDWQALWCELKSVFEFWMDHGVRIFRVDNPHTKALAFWEWVIAELKHRDPGVIFLAEAFTKPKLMANLAKSGYCQSYTYFTWRNSKWELTEYLRELSQGPAREYFRPNFWPNTPDILHAALVHGGRPAFMNRLVLAATMSGNYGIYGPAFELCVNTPREPGSEEYLDSEKYEIKHWNLDAPQSLKDYLKRLNAARRAHPALQRVGTPTFHEAENDKIICYSKREGDDVLLVVVNLDPVWKQGGFVNLDLDALGVGADELFEVHDLLDDARYVWRGRRNYVELEPQQRPAHLFVVSHRQI